jgi:cysteine desulfurase
VIYLDHNATTPILPEVLEAMMPYLTTEWGDPSSARKCGAKLKSIIETAREQLAELIGATSRDIITEAICDDLGTLNLKSTTPTFLTIFMAT